MKNDTHERALKRAENALSKTRESVAKGVLRQNWHFMPPAGWINDPNGLIYYKGQYHLFYQHHPFCTQWGPMHWGHAVSSDMLHWEHLPLALAPSETYERGNGCFSGTAIEKDGKLYLLYTGSDTSGPIRVQSQCLAISEDGVHFVKYQGNPVIPMPPPGFDGANFRDPKVWQHGDKYYLLCCSKRDERGAALLYGSEDLLNWQFVNVMDEADENQGSMWECPDLFEINGKTVFMFSPIGARIGHNLYKVGYLDYVQGRFVCEHLGVSDYGPDSYAGQTLRQANGKRALIFWAGTWPWMPWHTDGFPTQNEGWCGYLTAPRELELDDLGRLVFRPLPALEALRQAPEAIPAMLVRDCYELPFHPSSAFEMILDIDTAATCAKGAELEIELGEGRSLVVGMDFHGHSLSLNRTKAYENSRGCSQGPWPEERGLARVHLLVDQSSVELFAGGYRAVHSASIFSAAQSVGIVLRVDHPKEKLAIAGGMIWRIKSMEKDADVNDTDICG